MTREFYRRVRDIYARAREVDFTKRQQWLVSECDGDDKLRLEVESLLRFAAKPELPGRMRDVRLLDQGGFARVFAAVDDEWGPVAVKKLLNTDGHSIQRFKNEFRLRYQPHANLVRVFGLIAHKDEWLLVMELLEGETLRTALDRRSSDWGYARIDTVLAQIAAGLNALHSHAILHRDLKPGNVWLKAGDEVVLLDFGLAKKSGLPIDEAAEKLFGTRGYVSPERMEQTGDSEAGDWYSVGVMLWEMLCGPLPGCALRSAELTFPSGTPIELQKLCVGLLHHDADQRAGAREVAAYLAERTPETIPSGDDTPDPPPLVGRDYEFSRLQQYLKEARDGHPVCVFLTGGTGTGKTELAQAFLGSISPWALSLRGRCYEAESVSYKACDALVDDVAARLRGMPAEKRNALLPRNLTALEKAFPVLRDLWPDRPELSGPDSAEAIRDLAFLALRELIGRIAEGRSVVLFIDDLHWGDIDSALVLSALLSGADSPSALFLLAWRDEPQLAPLPAWLLEHEYSFRPRVERIALNPLAEADSSRLARVLLGDRGARHEELIRAITHASEGNPFLIHELAAGLRLHHAASETATPSNALDGLLSAAMARRVNSMSATARALLGVIAVAGEPLPNDVAQSVSNAGGNYARARAELLEMRVARAVSRDKQTDLDIYHARQRQTATAVTGVNPEEVHGEIARAFMRRDEPQKVFHHLRYSSDTSRCAHFSELAGDRAFDKLAFRQAATLYQETFQWLGAKDGDGANEKVFKLYRKLAEALAAAGLGAGSAAAYRHAAEASGDGRDGRRLSMQVLAAGQLLYCGALDEGLAAFRQACAEAGVPYPRHKATVYSSILWLRLKLWARGLRTGTGGDLSLRRQIQMDTCWTGLIGTSMLETSRSAGYSARYLLWALDAGEPRRLSRALAAEAAVSSAATIAGIHPHRLLEKARELDGQAAGSPETGFISCMACIVAFNHGDWSLCLAEGAKALSVYRERGSGGGWERVTAATYWLSARIFTGDWKGAIAELPLLLHDSAGRGDKYAAVNLQLLSNCLYAELGAGRAAKAREIARELHREWGQPRFDMQRFCSEMIRIDCDLYEGDHEHAWQAFRSAEAEMRRTELWHVPILRDRLAYTGACSAIALASEDSKRREHLLRTAQGFSNWLIRTGRRYAAGTGQLTKAGVASVRGEWRAAETSLRTAQEHFEATGMKPALAVSAARLGMLAGEPLEIPWFTEQEIDSVEKLSNTLAPGRWHSFHNG